MREMISLLCKRCYVTARAGSEPFISPQFKSQIIFKGL